MEGLETCKKVTTAWCKTTTDL